MILAIDPGNERSAWCVYNGGLVTFGIDKNDDLLFRLEHGDFNGPIVETAELAIEMIASYGMPVGREIFETCLWIGRFIQVWGERRALVYRKDVKVHLCGSPRAKDSNIRRALIDRFGGDKEIKRGGQLYKVSADVWSALAIAVTHSDSVRSAA